MRHEVGEISFIWQIIELEFDLANGISNITKMLKERAVETINIDTKKFTAAKGINLRFGKQTRTQSICTVCIHIKDWGYCCYCCRWSR